MVKLIKGEQMKKLLLLAIISSMFYIGGVHQLRNLRGEPLPATPFLIRSYMPPVSIGYQGPSPSILFGTPTNNQPLANPQGSITGTAVPNNPSSFQETGNNTLLPYPGDSTTGSTTTGSTTPTSSFDQAGYLAGIQQQYNSAIQGGSNLIGQNQANLPINQANLNNYTLAQENAARATNQNQVNTYNTQKQGVQNQQNLSLANLADQIRGQNQGLQAQLGAVGAGNSSAVGQGQLALAHEQNANRANIQQQTGANVANIDALIQQTQSTLDPYLATLQAYKQQQSDQILQNYNTLQTQLEQSIGTAQGEEKARLAMFGQQLQDSAGAALTQLDQQIGEATKQFASQQQQNFQGPQYQAPTLAAAPPAITSPRVSPFSISQPTGNSTASPGGGSYIDLLRQQQAGALA